MNLRQIFDCWACATPLFLLFLWWLLCRRATFLQFLPLHYARKGLSSISDIISSRCLGLFGDVARLDTDVPARDVLQCAYAHRTKIHPLFGWRRPPGRSRQTWLHQIGDGSTASICQEWDIAVGCGHSRRTRSALRASIAQAFWWCWWWVGQIPKEKPLKITAVGFVPSW